MSLKRKIINFFLAAAVAVAGVPGIALNARAEGGDLDAPEVQKQLKDNGDGTYTISLSVKGQKSSSENNTKANVVVVLDTSGSMGYCADTGSRPRPGDNCQTRLDVAKSALKSLGQQLLSNNKPGSATQSDMVEVAYVDFSSDVNKNQSPTTSSSTFNSWVNSASANGGTNWEAALKAANEVNFGDNDQTYVIFVSDGDATFRLSSHVGTCRDWSLFGGWREYECNDPDDSESAPNGVHGSGSSDPNGWNLADAKIQVNAITGAGKTFYAIGAFGDVETMQSLSSNYYDASNGDALNAAFADIISQISNNLSLTSIEFTDGITGETTAEINGSAGGFKYYKGVMAEGETDVTTLEEWANAPAASFEGGTVKWNLGDQTIENGETAAVSFVVYPSQEVLDLIADLNNGVEEWNDEYAADIVKSGDSYSLRTNTAGTKMTYQVVNQKTVNGQTTTELSEVRTAEITNPEPVELYSEKLDVKKIWEDSLDGGSERSEIDDVVLDLYRDGEKYISEITLDASNADADGNWALADEIAIAPGIMVSEGHSAYAAAEVKAEGTDATGANVEYAILDTGHDYEFREDDIDRHFELNNNTFHPMLVDGDLMNVKVTKDGDGKVTSFEIIGAIEDHVTATNTLKGGINIEKKVIDNDGNEIEPKNADGSAVKFAISAELKTPEGEAYACEYKVYDAEGNASEKRYCDQSGKVSEEISVGELIRVINVSAGTKYIVSEDEGALETGYSLNDIEYEISKNSKDNYEDDTAEEGYYVVQGNSASRATVTNEYLTGSLTIGKSVKVLSGNIAQAKGKEFEFTVTLTGKNGEDLRTEEFTLKDGKTYDIDDIPAGASYTVSETAVAGFRTNAQGETGTIVARENAEAEFVNTYSVAPVERELSAFKMFGVDDEWWRGDEFIFALLDAERNEIERKNVNALSKTAVFTVNISDEIDAVYYITEIEEGFRGGVSRPEADPDVMWKVKAVDQGDGTLAVTAFARGDRDFITNIYETEPVEFGAEGSETEDWLKVTKELEASEEPEEEVSFEFVLELAGTDVEGFEFAPQSVTINGAGEAQFESILFEEAGEYVFTIVEMQGFEEFYSYDPSVYFLDIIVEDDDEGHLVIAEVNLIRLCGDTAEESESVIFTNFYNPVTQDEEAVIPKTPETGSLMEKVLSEYAGANESATYTSYVLGFAAVFLLTGLGLGVRMYTKRDR